MCRDVSTLVARGQVSALPWRCPVQVWAHLAMCRHCGRFWRQIRTIDRALRQVVGRMESEGERTAPLEQKIVDRLDRDE